MLPSVSEKCILTTQVFRLVKHLWLKFSVKINTGYKPFPQNNSINRALNTLSKQKTWQGLPNPLVPGIH